MKTVVPQARMKEGRRTLYSIEWMGTSVVLLKRTEQRAPLHLKARDGAERAAVPWLFALALVVHSKLLPRLQRCHC